MSACWYIWILCHCWLFGFFLWYINCICFIELPCDIWCSCNHFAIFVGRLHYFFILKGKYALIKQLNILSWMSYTQPVASKFLFYHTTSFIKYSLRTKMYISRWSLIKKLYWNCTTYLLWIAILSSWHIYARYPKMHSRFLIYGCCVIICHKGLDWVTLWLQV